MKNQIIRRPFSVEALSCLPQISEELWSPQNFTGRIDLRERRRVFSVDPPGCQDIDDAMSVEWLRAGLLEISVHIADVCSFLKQGSPLDLEALRRGITVYLSHERIDMLPGAISANAASLLGGVDRYAVSVSWLVEVRHKTSGELVKESLDLLSLDEKDDLLMTPLVNEKNPCHWAGRTLIHSVAAMTYEQADNLIRKVPPGPTVPPKSSYEAGQIVPESKWSELSNDLRMLTAFSRVLKQKRFSSGAIDLSKGRSELKFKLDSSGLPIQAIGKEELEVHETIAELMILANSSVCALINNKRPTTTLCRIHPPPTKEKLSKVEDLSKMFAPDTEWSYEVQSKEDCRVELSRVMKKLSLAEKKDDKVDRFISSMLVRTMSEAKYISSSLLSGDEDRATSSLQHLHGHAGLGLSRYTHFTSPIRRYADIIVHRQLLAILPLESVDLRLPAFYFTYESDSSSLHRLTEHRAEGAVLPLLEIVHNKSNEFDDDVDLLLNCASGGIATSVPFPPKNQVATLDDDFLDELLSKPTTAVTTIPSVSVTTVENDIKIIESEDKIGDPYPPSELSNICDHLNQRNRAAKVAQYECQNYFLMLSLRGRFERHCAVVYSLKENGFLVYVPSIGFRGPCYLKTTSNGPLSLDPTCIGLDKSAGQAPSE